MKNKPLNHGQRWAVDEMFELSEMYINNKSWPKIVWKLQRTETACKCRMHLVKLAFTLVPHAYKVEDIMEKLV